MQQTPEALRELARIAASHGGSLAPDQTYQGFDAPLWFIDADGARFSRTPAQIFRGRWAPGSHADQRDPDFQMRELREIAKLRGGFLEDGQEYRGTHEKLWFVDKLGNRFQATPSNIKLGSWSPFESKQNIRERASERLNRLLGRFGWKLAPGEKYQNSHKRMTFIDNIGDVHHLSTAQLRFHLWLLHDTRKKGLLTNSEIIRIADGYSDDVSTLMPEELTGAEPVIDLGIDEFDPSAEIGIPRPTIDPTEDFNHYSPRLTRGLDESWPEVLQEYFPDGQGDMSQEMEQAARNDGPRPGR